MIGPNPAARKRLPRADAPAPPKPPAPVASCITCGRPEVEVVQNGVLDSARLYPHRSPLDGLMCHDANRYEDVLAAWWKAHP